MSFYEYLKEALRDQTTYDFPKKLKIIETFYQITQNGKWKVVGKEIIDGDDIRDIRDAEARYGNVLEWESGRVLTLLVGERPLRGNMSGKFSKQGPEIVDGEWTAGYHTGVDGEDMEVTQNEMEEMLKRNFVKVIG